MKSQHLIFPGWFCEVRRGILFFPLALLCISSSQKETEKVVLCVGDSITRGTWLQDPETQSYPVALQKRLGPGYVVERVGIDGLSIPIPGSIHYLDSTANGPFFASQDTPDIIVCMFGTNNARYSLWESSMNVTEKYIEFVDTLREFAGPQVEIILVLPPPGYDNVFDIIPHLISDSVVPALTQAALQLNLPVVDCFTPLENRPDLLIDGIHPTAEGADSIAHYIEKKIRDL